MLRKKWWLMEEASEGTNLPGGEPPADDSQVDKWADLMRDDEDEGEEEQPAPEPTPEPPAPVAKPQEPQVPAEPEQPQEQPVAPATPQEQKPVLTPEQVKEIRGKFEDALAARYQFSDEETLALQTEPEKVLPKLAAKMYADVLDDVNRMLQQTVPVMLQEYSVVTERETKARGEFFSAWPELAAHEQQVLYMGQMYRNMNPTASPQEAIQRIGEMTMAALGLRRQAAEEPPPAAPQAPFRPAAAGRVATPPPPAGKWDQFLDDDD